MFGQIVAFLALATTALAFSCGQCYSGYGGYESLPVSFLNTGACGSRVLAATPIIASGVYGGPIVSSGACATPFFREAVGGPEVISSCENSYGPPLVATGVVSSGIRQFGSTFGGCGARVIAAAC